MNVYVAIMPAEFAETRQANSNETVSRVCTSNNSHRALCKQYLEAWSICMCYSKATDCKCCYRLAWHSTVVIPFHTAILSHHFFQAEHGINGYEYLWMGLVWLKLGVSFLCYQIVYSTSYNITWHSLRVNTVGNLLQDRWYKTYKRCVGLKDFHSFQRCI